MTEHVIKTPTMIKTVKPLNSSTVFDISSPTKVPLVLSCRIDKLSLSHLHLRVGAAQQPETFLLHPQQFAAKVVISYKCVGTMIVLRR